jgi:hypothetical protein
VLEDARFEPQAQIRVEFSPDAGTLFLLVPDRRRIPRKRLP